MTGEIEMRIEKFVLGYVSTNAYVVINDETKECFVVDPGESPDVFLLYFQNEGLTLKGILLTHGHYDHIGGVEALVERYQPVVYALEEERHLLAEPKENLSTMSGREMMVEDFIALHDGETLEIAGMKLLVIATPGHTAGGASYYNEVQGVLFAGDTLFQNSIGRTDLPTGNHETLIRSIKEKLFILPEDTIVYPGHMGETTIEHEKQYNPYAR